MAVIQMPGGAVEDIAGKDLWWMRKAFDAEWKGAIMLRLGDSSQIFSIESLDDLIRKFKAEKTPLAKFTPPDSKLTMVVNAANVKKVEPANPIFHHEKAKTALRFTTKIKLAVRETPEEAEADLRAAKKEVGVA